jgi:hypothetical protein
MITRDVDFFSFDIPAGQPMNVVHGSAGFIASQFICLEVQDPGSILWRPADRVFPGEQWRIKTWDSATGQPAAEARKRYELEQREADRSIVAAQNIRFHSKFIVLAAICATAATIFAIIAISYMIFRGKPC